MSVSGKKWDFHYLNQLQLELFVAQPQLSSVTNARYS